MDWMARNIETLQDIRRFLYRNIQMQIYIKTACSDVHELGKEGRSAAKFGWNSNNGFHYMRQPHWLAFHRTGKKGTNRIESNTILFFHGYSPSFN
jgi:hypothetical protein